jgi:predicted nucleic acid-binding Zn ribbon protein
MATVRSIVSWYMTRYNLSSEVAKELNEFHWWGYLPAWKEAEDQGFSITTIYMRRTRNSPLYDMDVITKPLTRYCLGCGADISSKRKQARFCSEKCRTSHHYITRVSTTEIDKPEGEVIVEQF